MSDDPTANPPNAINAFRSTRRCWTALALGTGPDFCCATQRLRGRGLTPPPPSDPDFIVGKIEILWKEILIRLFLDTNF